MKGYGEQVAALPFTTNQEDLLSLYGFMRGHGPPTKPRALCAEDWFVAQALGRDGRISAFASRADFLAGETEVLRSFFARRKLRYAREPACVGASQRW